MFDGEHEHGLKAFVRRNKMEEFGLQTGSGDQVPVGTPKKLRLRPRNGLVTIRILPKPKTTAQGIILPEGGLGMMFEIAEVVAVGPGVLLDSPAKNPHFDYFEGVHGGTDDLKPGMRVLVKTGEAQPIQRGPGIMGRQEMKSMLDFDDGSEEGLGLINQSDILAIVEEVDA